MQPREVPISVERLIELTAERTARKAAEAVVTRHEQSCPFYRLPVLKTGFIAGVIAALTGAFGGTLLPFFKSLFGG